MNICDQSISESINIIWLIEKIQEQKFSFFNNGFNKQENNSSISNDKYLDSILDVISTDLMNQMKILKSEIEIDNIFNASFVDNKEKYLKEILRHKLESENFKEKIELFRQSGIVKTSRKYSYSTTVSEKENIELESLLQENYLLKKQIEEYKSNQIEHENKLLQEKSEELTQIQTCLTQSNQDLEEQISECFELYSQIKTLKDNESRFQSFLQGIILKVTGVSETALTTLELFELLNKFLDNNKPNNNNIIYPTNDPLNDSILDMENFGKDIYGNDSPCQISTGKIKPKSKLPKLFASSRKSNSRNSGSLLNLDTFHLNDSKDDLCVLLDKFDFANVLIDKLDKLDWEDVDKMEILVEKSFHIFTEVVIDLYSTKDESFVQKLKNCINEFSQILTSKVKSCQFKKIDLDSTCIFEKLEQEVLLEAANVELSEQLNAALIEKSRIEIELENERLGNQSLKSKLEDCMNTISVYEKEKNRIFKENSLTLESLHTKLEDFKLVNRNLENSLSLCTQTVESYETEIEKLTNENQILQSEMNKLNEIKEKLSPLSDQLNISQVNQKILLNELEEKNKLINELEEKLSSLEKVDNNQCLIDLEHGKEFTDISEQLNVQTIDLVSPFDDSFHLSNEFGNLNDSIIENRIVISDSTSKEIDKLKVDLELHKDQFQILEIKLEEKENIIRDILNENLTWSRTNNELEKQLEKKESELSRVKFDLDEMKLENSKIALNFQTEKHLMQVEISENLNLIANLKKLNDELNDNNEVNERAISLQNIENENNNFKLRLLEKENMIYDFTEELKIRNDEIVSLKQQIQLTEQDILMKTEKDSLQNETIHNKLIAKCERFENDFQQLKLLMSEREEEITCLKEDIAGLRLKLEEYENKLIEESKNRIEIENLTLNLETKKNELLKLENEHKLFVEKLNLTLEINQSLEDKISDLNTGLIKTLETDLERLSVLMGEKEEKINSYIENTIGLQLKLDEYEKKLVEGEKNLTEIENLRLYSETKENELIELQNEHENIVEKQNLLMEINRSLEEKIIDLSTNLVQNPEELTEEIKYLKKELSQKQEIILQMSDEKLKGYTNQLVEGEKEIEIENLRLFSETKENELIELQNEHKNIVEKQNSLLEINRSLEEKIADLSTNLVQNTEELTEEIKYLKKELSQKQEIILQMCEDKVAVELNMELLKDQLKLTIEKIEEDREEFELINVNAKKAEAQLEMELEKSFSDLQSLQKNLSTCQNLLKERNIEIKIITEANEIIENELEQSKTHLDKVKLELVYKEQEFIKVNDDFKAISKELTMMKDKEKLLKQSLSSVKDDTIAQYENEIESLRKQIGELKMPDEASRDALQLEINKLKSELSEKEKVIVSQREAVQTFNVLVGHYGELKTRYRTKRSQMEALDAKLKQVKEERDNFKRLLCKD